MISAKKPRSRRPNAAKSAFGRLDIQHNNAALITLQSIEDDTDILGIPTEAWDNAMRVTLRGTMLSCRYAIRAMLETGGGSIINTASMYGVMPHHHQPAYCTAKAAIIYLTKQVATTFGRQNIRCNVVAPSMIRTPTLVAATPEPIIQFNAEQTLTAFLGEPQDIADIVAFLASDQSRYLTGQLICADGGSTVHLPTYARSMEYFGGA
ncbi:MAG: SDR family oxidoreductase [Novosphingobium sp.]